MAKHAYDLSAFVKTKNVAGRAWLALDFWVSVGGTLTITQPVESASSSGSTGWTKLRVQGVAPAGTRWLRIEFRLAGPGTLWVDDAALFDAGTTAPSPVTPPTVSGTAREHVALRASAGEWSGLPTSYEYQWQRRAVRRP